MEEWQYKKYKFFYDQVSETAEAIWLPETPQGVVGTGKSVVKLDNIKSKKEADSKLKEKVDKL